MSLIDKYFHFGNGYEPFLITPNWQVAQLNSSPELTIDRLDKIERHINTDEVFILTRGRAVLIAAENVPEAIWFEILDMKTGMTYNITKGRWHNIVMTQESEIIIVEDTETHKNDVEYYKPDPGILEELKKKLRKIL